MRWNHIDSLEDINQLISNSKSKPQVIFKHSTLCSISSMAKMRLEDQWHEVISELDFHYLDLLSFRKISNHITEHLEVDHESPQVILLDKGEVIYDASHFDITIDELNESLNYHSERP